MPEEEVDLKRVDYLDVLKYALHLYENYYDDYEAPLKVYKLSLLMSLFDDYHLIEQIKILLKSKCKKKTMIEKALFKELHLVLIEHVLPKSNNLKLLAFIASLYYHYNYNSKQNLYLFVKVSLIVNENAYKSEEFQSVLYDAWQECEGNEIISEVLYKFIKHYGFKIALLHIEKDKQKKLEEPCNSFHPVIDKKDDDDNDKDGSDNFPPSSPGGSNNHLNASNSNQESNSSTNYSFSFPCTILPKYTYTNSVTLISNKDDEFIGNSISFKLMSLDDYDQGSLSGDLNHRDYQDLHILV